MKAVILLAGHGTRMQPLTNYLNKGMIPVAGKPIVEHIVVKLKKQGFESFIIAATMFPEQLQHYLGDGGRWGVEIEHVTSDEPSQTAGEIAAMAGRLADEEHFLVHYGDIISNFDAAAMVRRHIKTGATATLGLVSGISFHGGVADLDGHGMVVDFAEKPQTSFATHAAIDVFSARALRYCAGGMDFGHDVIPQMLAGGESVAGFLDPDAYWFDVGRISDIDTVNDCFSQKSIKEE